MSQSVRHDPFLSNSLEPIAEIVAQISARLERGEPVDWEQLIQQHASYATELQELRPAIESLLSLGINAGDSMSPAAPREETDAGPHRTLGDYEIVRQVGRGGMGVVYEARQISLDRQVALKVLPFAVLANPQQLRRFKNEARAAASLLHPHIVPVFAVGCDRGIHYYAMQFIEGPSLAEVLSHWQSHSQSALDGSPRGDAHSPTVELGGRSTVVQVHSGSTSRSLSSAETGWELQANLSTQRAKSRSVFFRTVAGWGVQVAGALGYAHENGVLHRDIKPGNLLLDGAGQLWITDFGLARLEKDASLTMTGDIVGTLRYMAPEQALAKRILIDHRADVYSLGVTLYELIALRPLFDGKDREELLKQIAFDEPLPLRKIDASVPPELQTIVQKAIRKNPDDRYGAAQELADDLQRFLDNRPIIAKPPTLAERAHKWMRRHQTLMAAGAMLLLLTAIGSAVGTILILQANRQTAKALKASRENYDEAERLRSEAVRRVHENEAVVDFLVHDLIGAASPEKAQGRPPTVKEVLANAEARIDAAFEEDSLIEASIQQALGGVYLALREVASAERHIGRAVELRLRLLGTEHRDTLQSMYSQAEIAWLRGDRDAFREQLQNVLTLQRRVLGPEDPDTLRSLAESASLVDAGDDFEAAHQFLQEIWESQRRILGPQHHDTLQTRAAQADLKWRAGDLASSEQIHAEVLRSQRAILGDKHPDTIRSVNGMAIVLAQQGKFTKAEPLFEEALEASRDVMGSNHQVTLVMARNLGWDLEHQARYEEAQRRLEQAVSISRNLHGARHPNTAEIMSQVGELLQKQGKLDEAQRHFESVFDVYRRVYGENHGVTRAAVNQLVWNLLLLRRTTEVRDWWLTTVNGWLEAASKAPVADQPAMLDEIGTVAARLPLLPNFVEAVQLMDEIANRQRRLLGASHPQTRRAVLWANCTRASLGSFPVPYADLQILLEAAEDDSDQVDLAQLLLIVGDSARREARDALALRAFAAASAVYGRVTEPQRSRGQEVCEERSHALLALSPDQDPAAQIRALQRMRMSTRQGNPAFLLGLGAGQYRAGDYGGALATLRQALAARWGRVDVGRLHQGGQQRGITSPGSFGFQWHVMEVEVDADGGTDGAPIMRWRIDGREIGAVNGGYFPSAVMEGHVTLGYNDPYASVSEAPEFTFALIDNLRVMGGGGETVFADDFAADSSADYQVIRTSPDTRATFAYDYSQLGIPSPPRGGDGASLGLKLEANMKRPPGPESITLHTQHTFSGDYVVQFDAWMNWCGPCPDGGDGSTEYLLAGVGGDALSVNRSGNDQLGIEGSGTWMAVDGDGGSFARDFRLFVGNQEVLAAEAFVAGPDHKMHRFPTSLGYTQQDSFDPYYAGYGLPSFEWLLMAMAHWQLGERDAARQAFARAVEIMAHYTSEDDWPAADRPYVLRRRQSCVPSKDLLRLRREAELLMEE